MRTNLWGRTPFREVHGPIVSFDAGTSMATPLVAGCASVVREFFIKVHKHHPSAALVKAMLINGAKSMKDNNNPTEVDGLANCSAGFGRVDLASTVGPLPDTEKVNFKDEGRELETGKRN